jgi:hypothetical protein
MNLKFFPAPIFKSIDRYNRRSISSSTTKFTAIKQLRFAAGLFFATSLATSLNIIGSSAPASANQCIYNQAGYIARVKWYKPSDIEISRDTSGNIAAGLKNPDVKPVREQQITLGRESCTGSDQQHLAVVSIGATAGAGCVAGAAAAGVVVDGFARTALPDAKEVFYVDIPPAFQKRRLKQDLRLIIFGTVFDPKVRFGAIIK